MVEKAKRIGPATVCLIAIGLCSGRPVSAEANKPSPDQTAPNAAASSEESSRKELFTGKVVPVREALKRRGVEAYSELDGQFALETPDGELVPIVPDWRGRAFFQDKRLRNRKVELIGTRPKGTPYLQVIVIYTFDEDGVRQYTDYWCDICSIPMYEIKPCDCCQGPTRLRFQPRDLPDVLKKDDSPSSSPAGSSAGTAPSDSP